MFITEPWMLCTYDMCRMDVYIWGKEKILCSNKMCEKNTFLFSLGIFQSLIKSRGGKWVGFYCDFSIDSFYCDIALDICWM